MKYRREHCIFFFWGTFKHECCTHSKCIKNKQTNKTKHQKTGQFLQFSSVQSLSCVWPFETSGTGAHQAFLSITNSRACSNSCQWIQWCHPTISSSVISFSCLQSFPESGSFPVSQFFHQVAKVWSFRFSFSPYIEYSGLISFRIDLLSKGLSGVFSNTMVQKHQFFSAQWWFSWQEYVSRLLCPPPGDLPNPRIEPRSAGCRWILYRRCHQGSLVSL